MPQVLTGTFSHLFPTCSLGVSTHNFLTHIGRACEQLPACSTVSSHCDESAVIVMDIKMSDPFLFGFTSSTKARNG